MFLFRSKITYPAPERNKSFILEVLRKHFETNKEGNVLEISSGTGQHISYFAQHFPSLTFHPSEFDRSLFDSIKAYSCESKNIKEPIFIDVRTDCDSWKLPRIAFDYLININMMHIAPFECAAMLFKNASKLLKQDGVLVTYGPYACGGVLEPQSNIDFDRNLRAQNANWGVRDLVDLKAIADENRIELSNTYDLPANNKCLIWKKLNKITYPAADRNKPFILEVLQKHFDADRKGNVLEISSGTGQHVTYFAPNFPLLTFYPSEYDKSLFDSIRAYAAEVASKNVAEPIYVDSSTDYSVWDLKCSAFDYLININMMQVSPYVCSIMLFKNAGKLLKSDGLMITYGPYALEGVIAPQSNVDFDKNLRAQNEEWGIRDLRNLEKLAEENGIKLLRLYDLPANNKCLVWKKL